MAATALLALGAAGSLAGAGAGIMGANNAAKASKQANNMAMLQFLEQRRLAELAQRQAEEGTTDSRGNRTRYVPGVGFVTELTEASRRIQTASDAEELQRNTVDAASSRAIREMAARRQAREAGLADATLAQRDVGARTQEGVQSALIASKAARAMAGSRAMQRNVNLGALRQGSGGEVALAELGRSGLEDARTAIADARLEAAPTTVAQNAARLSANDASYNMLASRATNPLGNTFRPSTISDGTSGARAAQQQALANAMGVRAPQFGFAEDRTPTAIAGLGSAAMSGSNLLREYQKMNAPRNAYDARSIGAPTASMSIGNDFGGAVPDSTWLR
ncbi:hypothetical protein UFOVP568_40 [uncultured Caudovirales phage]|uniref:Uncharacterized protein n=1 Tax=uncultured Caudovirales phage TaxID=2100421 RepID=A0A6J5MV04_9CAUD|nr:hypothetical protein UFOVP568_40 [uncultured Caudovirales phage]